MAKPEESGIHYRTDMWDNDIDRRTMFAPLLNRQMVVGAVDVVRDSVRRFYGHWEEQGYRGALRQAFCGVYLVGSFAVEKGRREWGRDSDDVDLLVVDRMHFAHSRSGRDHHPCLNGNHLAVGIADLLMDRGFDLEVPPKLPTEYNVGDIDAKWLMRATPRTQDPKALPMDFNIVNLNDRNYDVTSLDEWLAMKDVDGEGRPLGRLPLLEVEVVSE